MLLFSGTSKYSTNLEHINLWIYGRNIRIYGYMEGKFVHTNAHQIRNIQINGLMDGTLWRTDIGRTHWNICMCNKKWHSKIWFKDGIFEYTYIWFHFLECRFISYRHQIHGYNLLLCVFPYSEFCQIDYLDWFPLYSNVLDIICQKEMIQSVVNAFIFSVSLQKYELFSQHIKSTNQIHTIDKFKLIIILKRKSLLFN